MIFLFVFRFSIDFSTIFGRDIGVFVFYSPDFCIIRIKRSLKIFGFGYIDGMNYNIENSSSLEAFMILQIRFSEK